MNVGIDQAGNEVAAGPVDFLPALNWPLAHLLDAPVADTHVGMLQRRSAFGRDHGHIGDHQTGKRIATRRLLRHRLGNACVRGDGLSMAARAEMVKPSLHIGTAHQFPNFAPYLPKAEQRSDLAAGLGVIVFAGPQGRGFYKGGHDGQTANTFVCLERSRRCVLLLANDVRAEASFAELVRFVLGETGVPYDWEYAGQAGKS
jgi:hypothetical protein